MCVGRAISGDGRRVHSSGKRIVVHAVKCSLEWNSILDNRRVCVCSIYYNIHVRTVKYIIRRVHIGTALMIIYHLYLPIWFETSYLCVYNTYRYNTVTAAWNVFSLIRVLNALYLIPTRHYRKCKYIFKIREIFVDIHVYPTVL